MKQEKKKTTGTKVRRLVLWGSKVPGKWLGTIGLSSFWFARVEKKVGKWHSTISHQIFSEGIISSWSQNFDSLEEAKKVTGKKLLLISRTRYF